ncbi:hypothetical protein D9M70_473260 [compost metagenome]
MQIDDIGEVNRVLAADHVAGDEARRTQDHSDTVEVRLVDEGVDTVLQPEEGVFSNGLFVLLGFEISSRKQSHQVLQFAAPEL